jgi:hypothetical protein
MWGMKYEWRRKNTVKAGAGTDPALDTNKE